MSGGRGLIPMLIAFEQSPGRHTNAIQDTLALPAEADAFAGLDALWAAGFELTADIGAAGVDATELVRFQEGTLLVKGQGEKLVGPCL